LDGSILLIDFISPQKMTAFLHFPLLLLRR
jgi:hypothetical protein